MFSPVEFLLLFPAVDFDALFVALREVEYDGPVIMEPYCKLIRSDEALERSIAFMREKMQ